MSISTPHGTRRTTHATSRSSRRSVHKQVPGSSTSVLFRWRCDVPASRAHPVIGAAHADADAVILAVARVRRHIAEKVLAVQLFRDSRRRFGELLAAVHDLGAAAALIGDV